MIAPRSPLARGAWAIVSCALVSLFVVSLVACSGDTFQSTPDGGGETDGIVVKKDGGGGGCKPGQDSDNDGIPDEVEGCGPPEVDTDLDNVPDYLDNDSDNDGVYDSIEGAGDTDGDGVPDFRDDDSDNDGVKDGDEDLNGDGLLGCCLKTCGEIREGCPAVKSDECGPGQQCQGGSCSPAATFLCSNGETNPKSDSTFGPGKKDNDLPTFICHKAGEQGGSGLKPIDFGVSKDGGWKIALERGTVYGDALIAGAVALEAAASFDMSGPSQAVAGFVLSMPVAAGADIDTVHAKVIQDITTRLTGKSKVTQASSGQKTESHDKFPTIVSAQLLVDMSAAVNPPTVRNAIFEAVLAKQVTQLPTPNYGPSEKSHVLRFQTLLRSKEKRIIVFGAVAAASMFSDATKQTGIHVDDLSNGTGLATASDSDTVECDPFVIDATPVADIIWVVDESGSMNDNRNDVIANASDFFARALSSGLDFRMAVAGMKRPGSGVTNGKFCSQVSSTNSHDGGTDRFLSPQEQTIFKGCVKNPPYYEGGSEYGLAHAYEAVTRHLPRTANNVAKIRPEATLVLIIATDEAPQEFKSGGYKGIPSGLISSTDYNGTSGKCVLDAGKQTSVNNALKPWLDLYQGKDATHGIEGKAIVHLIGGLCNSTCTSSKPEKAHGYYELVKATGGIMADVCQKNLGTSMQLIIDSIVGAASPAILQYVPISASLAVAIGKQEIPRSRVKGFDYSPTSNALIFIGTPINKGTEVVASYRRYVKQGIIN